MRGENKRMLGESSLQLATPLERAYAAYHSHLDPAVKLRDTTQSPHPWVPEQSQALFSRSTVPCRRLCLSSAPRTLSRQTWTPRSHASSCAVHKSANIKNRTRHQWPSNTAPGLPVTQSRHTSPIHAIMEDLRLLGRHSVECACQLTSRIREDLRR